MPRTRSIGVSAKRMGDEKEREEEASRERSKKVERSRKTIAELGSFVFLLLR